MSDTSNQWLLFGFDTRRIAQHWISAWRDLLYAPNSPLRGRLDEAVTLVHSDGALQRFQGGNVLAIPATEQDGTYRACSLPEALTLTRSIVLPVGAEAELEAVVAMEVRASSPFAVDDTASGWREAGRDARGIDIRLAIASRSAVHRWLADQGLGEPLPEVWAMAGSTPVVLTGFGEARREQAYRRRLFRSAMLIVAVLLATLLAAGLFALHQRGLLQHREAQIAELQQRAADTLDIRTRMADANTTASQADALAAEHPNPHCELVRLTELLDDQAFIQSFQMRGRGLRLRGLAEDAARVMQTMAEAEDYEAVTAPQPIRPAGGGRELFYIDAEVSAGAAGRCA